MGFKYDLIEIYDTIEEKGNWATLLTKVSWKGRPPVYDIRKYDMRTLGTDNVVMGKGCSIESDESMDRLTDKLIEMGFGSSKNVKEVMNRDEDFFDYDEEDDMRKLNMRRRVK